MCQPVAVEDVAQKLQDEGVVVMGFCNLDAHLGFNTFSFRPTPVD
jgi:hypothetical protein